MNNLWRVIVLFMLPGMVWGGGIIIAFFRLGDYDLESLKVITYAAVTMTLAAALTMHCLQRVRGISSFYYPACAVMALAFALIPGICRWWGAFNLYEGITGMAIAGSAIAFFLQCFTGSSFSWRDRWSFIAGVAVSGGIVFFMSHRQYLSWLETLFFYLNELLLLSWLFASPLTLRGGVKRRWVLRCGLLLAAVIGFIFTPRLARSPRPEPPGIFSSSLWQKNEITAQGNRYQWCDKNDNYGFFTYRQRLINWGRADEEIVVSLPGLLSVAVNNTPAIKLAVPLQSVLQGWIRDLTAGKAVCSVTYWPESMSDGGTILKRQLKSYAPSEKKLYDLLLITILNDNPYPGAVERQLKKLLSELKDDGVVAVSTNLLQNAVVFRTLYEKFSFCGVLAGCGRIWVFSSRKLDLSPTAIDRNLNLLYGGNDFLPGDALQLGQGGDVGWQYFSPPQVEPLVWGNNRWLGSWYWLLPGVVLLMLWRTARLLWERRGNMYSYCNCVENGFSGMGIFLLAWSMLVINYGILLLMLAILALLLVGCMMRLRVGGVWCYLFAAVIFLWAAWSNCHYPAVLVMVMLLSMLRVGEYQMNYRIFPVSEQRKMWSGTAWGMMGAALLLWGIWVCQMPLLLAWGLFALVGISGIWQNEYKRVY